MTLKIIKTHPESKEARELTEELSSLLLEVTGDNGKSSFSNLEVDPTRSSFIVIQNKGENLACGSIRPLTDEICEIKRMYSRKPGMGLGKHVLNELEHQAKELGFKGICLSTRKINKKAVDFYLANNYSVCEPYGKYRNQPESVCFSKRIETF